MKAIGISLAFLINVTAVAIALNYPQIAQALLLN